MIYMSILSNPVKFCKLFFCRSGRLPLLRLRVVILNEVFEGAVSPTRVEVVLLHLLVHLIEIPLVKLYAINGPHHSGAMPPTGAMDEEFTRGWIVYSFEKHLQRFGCRVFLGDHGNVYISHSQ